jgi:hypothetical protein
LLKAPSSKEIAAGPAYFRPKSKKRIFVITITSWAQRRSSSPQKIEGMKAVHVYQSKYSPRSLGKISQVSWSFAPADQLGANDKSQPVACLWRVGALGWSALLGALTLQLSKDQFPVLLEYAQASFKRIKQWLHNLWALTRIKRVLNDYMLANDLDRQFGDVAVGLGKMLLSAIHDSNLRDRSLGARTLSQSTNDTRATGASSKKWKALSKKMKAYPKSGRWADKPWWSVWLLASAKTAGTAPKKTSTAARAVAALRGIFHSPCLKAPSSKEIAAGPAYSDQ